MRVNRVRVYNTFLTILYIIYYRGFPIEECTHCDISWHNKDNQFLFFFSYKTHQDLDRTYLFPDPSRSFVGIGPRALTPYISDKVKDYFICIVYYLLLKLFIIDWMTERSFTSSTCTHTRSYFINFFFISVIENVPLQK